MVKQKSTVRNSLGGAPRDSAGLTKTGDGWRSNKLLSLIDCTNYSTLKDYDFNVLIGQGAYAQVKRATHKESKEKVAIKQYEKSKLIQDMGRVIALQREMCLLSIFNHPGLMKFHDSIDSGNKISIVVEYINGSNLYQYIRKLPGSRIIEEE
jgi:serine/threonine protein kinase